MTPYQFKLDIFEGPLDLLLFLIKEQKISFASFGKPMRLLLTNNQDGPSLALIISILGKKNTFIRINNYINK